MKVQDKGEFDHPIIWTDELGNFLVLWLSMVGTVVALRGDGHMRLTTLVNWVRPSLGGWFNSVAALVVVAFVLEILAPARVTALYRYSLAWVLPRSLPSCD